MDTDAAEVIRLWPDGPPFTIDGMPEESSYVNPAGIAEGSTSIRNISDPTLSVYTPAASNGRGVIVVPGGGWTVNMWTHEGVDIAAWLCGLGYTCFVLKYRVQASEPDFAKFAAQQAAINEGVHSGTFPYGLKPRAIGDLISTAEYTAARDAAADDGRRAIAITRDIAARYGVDPATLGMIGFSAGAFLAVDVALDPQADQLAWIAPIYGGETRGKPVPADAPPLFGAVAQDDVLCRICEGLHLDWSDAERSSELHLFARGQHGFGLVEQKMPSDAWQGLFLAWLQDVTA